MSRVRKKPRSFWVRALPYFMGVLAVIALIAVLAAILVRTFRDPFEGEPGTTRTEQTPQGGDADAVQSGQPGQSGVQSDTPDGDGTGAPLQGTTRFLAGQRLSLTYDETELELVNDNGLHSLASLDGAAAPRMDLQELDTGLGMLKDAEIRRLAVGVLQSYYHEAPATADISVSNETHTDEEYRAVLSAPAHGDAPAATAKIRIMQLGDECWCAVLLLPQGTRNAALEQAYDNLTIR